MDTQGVSPTHPLKPVLPRSATDVCLLCKLRPATKTNSHIIPKFLNKAGVGRGRLKYRPGNAVGGGVSIPMQDLPKENHLFCPQCENRFSILETYAANKYFTRYQNPAYREDFPFERRLINYEGQLEFRLFQEPKKLSSSVFTLFLYSILFRCAVSTNGICNLLNMSDEDLEVLRILLYNNVHESSFLQTEQTANQLTKDKLPFYYNLIRPNKAVNPYFSNVHAVSLIEDMHLIMINEFFILFSNSNGVNSKWIINTKFDKILVEFMDHQIFEQLLEKRRAIFAAHDSELLNNFPKRRP